LSGVCPRPMWLRWSAQNSKNENKTVLKIPE
jgi:hypothetical protein